MLNALSSFVLSRDELVKWNYPIPVNQSLSADHPTTDSEPSTGEAIADIPSLIDAEMILDRIGSEYVTMFESFPDGTERSLLSGFYCTRTSSERNALFTSDSQFHNPLACASIDCEMVRTSAGQEIARITIVNGLDSTIVLDTFVLPCNHIEDYCTQYSGITAYSLREVTTKLSQVQVLLLRLLSADTILIGHSLDSDLTCLHIAHMRCIDTALLYPHPGGFPVRYKLKTLAKEVLDMDIQTSGKFGHDSVEDARAALLLAQHKATGWIRPAQPEERSQPAPADSMSDDEHDDDEDLVEIMRAPITERQLQNDLLSKVLSWTADDFCNENLLSAQLKVIPDRFNNSSEWYANFYPFILEEQRARMHAMALASFGDVESFSNCQVTMMKRDSNGSLEVRVDLQMTHAHQIDQWSKDLSHTLALLVDTPPNDLNPGVLRRRRHALISFQGSAYRSPQKLEELRRSALGGGFIDFTAMMSCGNYLDLKPLETERLDIYLLKIPMIPAMRICEALDCKVDSSIMDIISTGERDFNHLDLVSSLGFDLEEEIAELNSSQQDAVRQFFHADRCMPVSIIKGPPGTGKTKTLATLLRCFLVSGQRVHATAPTNQAVAELARRTMKSLALAETSLILSKVVLVGNMDRAAYSKDDMFDVIYQLQVDQRVLRLVSFSANMAICITTLRFILQDAAGSGRVIGRLTVDTTAISFQDACVKLWVQFREAPVSSFIQGRSERIDIINLLHRLVSDNDVQCHLQQWFKDHRYALPLGLVCQLVDLQSKLSVVQVIKYNAQAKMKLKHELIAGSSIVFSTVNSGGTTWLKSEEFDVALVDEASQLVQPETSILVKAGLKCLILAGDDKQLPPTVTSRQCVALGYGDSVMSRLMSLNYPHSLLLVQYRMHPQISYWPNVQFYDGRLEDGDNVQSLEYEPPYHKSFPPLMMYSLSFGKEEKTERGSFYNDIEARIVRILVNRLRSYDHTISIGIICPYAAQVDELKHLESFSVTENSQHLSIRVSTVDGFQGQECDVVIFSAVRSNSKKKIGFLRDQRRLNVALTRAKFSVLIVCSSKTLEGDQSWRSLIHHAQELNRFYDSSNMDIISKAEAKWMKEEARLQKFSTGSYLSLFQESPWLLEFSSDFQRAMQLVVPNKRYTVLKRIVSLASGEWPKYELKNIYIPEEFNCMIHVLNIEIYRLVWSIDIKHTSGKQYIRIWDVCLEKEMARAIQKVCNKAKSCTQQYIDACSDLEKKIGENVYLPKCFDPSKIAWYTVSANCDGLEEMQVSSSAALTKFYSLEDKIARLLFSSGDLSKIELPFVLSDEEDKLIRQDSSLIILGRSGTGKTTVILHRMFLLQTADSDIKQLLVTASPVLCGAIKQTYESMCRTGALMASGGNCEADGDEAAAITIISTNTAMDQPDILYESFADLQTNPLITTYFSFLRMLDNSISQPFFRKGQSVRAEDLIDFSAFSNYFFPRFSRECSRVGDATLIFTEIMTHIKGSLEAVRSSTGFLSEEQYLKCAQKRTSHLGVEERVKVYECFRSYEELKSQGFHGLFDILDIVHHIYHQLSSKMASYTGDIMDAVFVDEVQDLVPAQIARYIAPGVGFRFETLKDIFYDEFLLKKQAQLIPGISQLSENFRTHAGIVNIANSVVHLIERAFPFGIDKLSPEVSKIQGPKPLFVDSNVDIVLELFADEGVRFGADQVILVRNDDEKNMLLEMTGDRVLVLTAFEAKGMEFTDCLLYNFFSSSQLANRWRVVYNWIADTKEKFPAFEPHFHSGLCNELKMLYVLLTRAKQHLVIYDSDAKISGPMLDYWKQHELVAYQPFDENVRGIFLQASSVKEWQLQGLRFFERTQFVNAKLCFERAGDDYHVKVCKGIILEEDGNRTVIQDKMLAKDCYLKAIDVFLSLGLEFRIDAARCLEKAEKHKESAELYSLLLKHDRAAQCYEKAQLWRQAASSYTEMRDVGNALRCHLHVDDFEQALSTIKEFSDCSVLTPSQSQEREQEVILMAAKHFHRVKDSFPDAENVMMRYVLMLASEKMQKNFLQEHEYYDLLLQLALAHNNFEEVADVYDKLHFDFISAAKYYKEAGSTKSYIRCILKHLRLKYVDEFFCVSAARLTQDSLFDEVRRVVGHGIGFGHFLLEIRCWETMAGSGSSSWTDLCRDIEIKDNGQVWHIKYRFLVDRIQRLLTGNSSSQSQPQNKNRYNKHKKVDEHVSSGTRPAFTAAEAILFANAVLSLHKHVENLLKVLQKILKATDATEFTNAEEILVRAGLELFEFGIPEQLCLSDIAAKHFNNLTGLHSVPGYTAGFNLLANWKGRVNNKNVFQFQGKAVLQTALYTFQQQMQENAAIVQQRASTFCFTPTFTEHMSCIFNNKATIDSTAVKAELLVALHGIYSSELSKLRQVFEVMLRKVESEVAVLLSPLFRGQENQEVLTKLRTSADAIADKIIMVGKAYHARTIGAARNCDDVGKVLLFAELLNMSADGLKLGTQMRRNLMDSFRKSIDPDPAPYHFEAFGRHRNLLHSLGFTTKMLTKDVQEKGGAIFQALLKQHCDECLSPQTFAKLALRCVVLLILHNRSFCDVLLPNSVVSDVMFIQHDNFAAEVRYVQSLPSDYFKSKAGRNVRRLAADNLNRWQKACLKVLECVNVDTFAHWSSMANMSKIPDGGANKSKIPDGGAALVDDNLRLFLLQMVEVVAFIQLNATKSQSSYGASAYPSKIVPVEMRDVVSFAANEQEVATEDANTAALAVDDEPADFNETPVDNETAGVAHPSFINADVSSIEISAQTASDVGATNGNDATSNWIRLMKALTKAPMPLISSLPPQTGTFIANAQGNIRDAYLEYARAMREQVVSLHVDTRCSELSKALLQKGVTRKVLTIRYNHHRKPFVTYWHDSQQPIQQRSLSAVAAPFVMRQVLVYSNFSADSRVSYSNVAAFGAEVTAIDNNMSHRETQPNAESTIAADALFEHSPAIHLQDTEFHVGSTESSGSSTRVKKVAAKRTVHKVVAVGEKNLAQTAVDGLTVTQRRSLRLQGRPPAASSPLTAKPSLPLMSVTTDDATIFAENEHIPCCDGAETNIPAHEATNVEPAECAIVIENTQTVPEEQFISPLFDANKVVDESFTKQIVHSTEMTIEQKFGRKLELKLLGTGLIRSRWGKGVQQYCTVVGKFLTTVSPMFSFLDAAASFIRENVRTLEGENELRILNLGVEAIFPLVNEFQMLDNQGSEYVGSILMRAGDKRSGDGDWMKRYLAPLVAFEKDVLQMAEDRSGSNEISAAILVAERYGYAIGQCNSG